MISTCGKKYKSDNKIEQEILRNARTVINTRCMIGSICVSDNSNWMMIWNGLTNRLQQIDEVLFLEVKEALRQIYLENVEPFPHYKDRVLAEMFLIIERKMSVIEVAGKIGISQFTVYNDINVIAKYIDTQMRLEAKEVLKTLRNQDIQSANENDCLNTIRKQSKEECAQVAASKMRRKDRFYSIMDNFAYYYDDPYNPDLNPLTRFDVDLYGSCNVRIIC
ncbi:MAG: hypothetical protein ACM3UU_12020 [Ignavibacteriales bacterium]